MQTKLEDGDYTCVIGREEVLFSSAARGVRPLLDCLDSRCDVYGAAAADKVVGSAAAFLYVLLGVGAVYAHIISERAAAVLQSNAIAVSYDVLVPAIRNRAGDGFCPMETAVADIDDPAAALTAIRERLRTLHTK